MRKAIIVALLPLIAILMIVDLSGQSRKPRKKSTAKFDPTKKTESPCGVLQSLDEFIQEMQVERRVAAESNGSTYYYNTLKQVCDDKKILKIWVKEVQKDTMKSLSYSMDRYELNCHANQIRLMSEVEYQKDGVVIDSRTINDPKWADIIPDSVGESIWQTVCHKTPRKFKSTFVGLHDVPFLKRSS